MPRSLSAAAAAAIHAQETSEAFVVLLALSHPSLVSPIRVCTGSVATAHLGDIYQPFPFSLTMPDDSDDAPPEVTLQICNVDRAIIQAIRSIGLDSGPVQAQMAVVLASSPGVVEAGWYVFSVRNIDADALVISGRLEFEPVLNEPFPGDSMTPSRTPGIF